MMAVSYWKLFMLPHDWVFRIKIETENKFENCYIAAVQYYYYTTQLSCELTNGGDGRANKKKMNYMDMKIERREVYGVEFSRVKMPPTGTGKRLNPFITLDGIVYVLCKLK